MASTSQQTVANVLDQYGGLARIRPKTSVEEARKETNAGLKSRCDSERPQTAETAKSAVST
jgi:hypothetical protein